MDIEYETICKHKKEICIAETRQIAPIQDKFKKDIIWIIWDILLNQSRKNNNILITKIINSLLEMFSIKYSNSIKKRRKFIIYFAISLLTETIDLNISIIKNKDQIDLIVKKIEGVYKDVKKHEESINVDYLLNGIEKSNLEKTVERLEKMNSIILPFDK